MNLDDTTFLVTGGTGSFGREFAQLLLRAGPPKAVRILSRDELKQHDMGRQLAHPALRFLLGDVRDVDRLRRAMEGVDFVIHAAALKQVPACEYNPFEAVKTNILGAENVMEAAIDCGVKKVVALSTDKAVNPVNLYGATKLCLEKIFIQGNSYGGQGGTRFSVVRYGNVVGSRGSVLPLFLLQRMKGVLTITDRRMTRFWITLDRAAQFVLECLERMKGGEIFVPKIPSMQVLDLARSVAPEAQISEVGVRPGEKLHEVLLTEDEARHAREFDSYFVVEPEFPWWNPERTREGRLLPDDFRYASNTNEWWLKAEEMKTFVASRANGKSQNVEMEARVT
ncbi:MAG: UDP-N-acetylglucosamine 4,6-dehydratase (inverting) [Nitrospirae bacterium]|nr:UDP-N-acetylglucosamine 4,6-dehydratase (inverting) [Nitrospirota bacterium]